MADLAALGRGHSRADSGRSFVAAIENIENSASVEQAGARVAACRVELRAKSGPQRPMLASIGVDPAARRDLVKLTPAA